MLRTLIQFFTNISITATANQIKKSAIQMHLCIQMALTIRHQLEITFSATTPFRIFLVAE
ncbi:hypothetical protein Nizo2264_1112 [Lactiplantibacillus plantarum]|nr:hypothetical protein Nizo2264_1112 [Lactiplantibacillus plantarum]